jgi:hypothetical protein
MISRCTVALVALLALCFNAHGQEGIIGGIRPKLSTPGADNSWLPPGHDQNMIARTWEEAAPADVCVVASSGISLSESQVFVCNRSGTSLKFEMLLTADGEAIVHELGHGESRIIDLIEGSAIGSVDTNGTKRSFQLAPRKKYSLEDDQSDQWVFAEL